VCCADDFLGWIFKAGANGLGYYREAAKSKTTGSPSATIAGGVAEVIKRARVTLDPMVTDSHLFGEDAGTRDAPCRIDSDSVSDDE
jgi:hypothetical protein